MIEELSHPEYLDVQDDTQDWRVGKVLSKGVEGYKIRFDGDSANYDFAVGVSSKRLAPVRQYTKGYTGSFYGNRDDSLLDIDKLTQISQLVSRFSQKSYEEMDASFINSKLRTRVYLFIHSLFTRRNMNIDQNQIREIFIFLFKYLEFIVHYLKQFPKDLSSKFDEGLKDRKRIVNRSAVAYSHFIYEAIDSLFQIFGFEKQYSSFFEHKFDEKTLGQFKSKYNDPNIVRRDQGWKKASPEWGSQDELQIVENQNLSLKELLGEIMMNRFAALGGFSLLAQIISGAKGTENNGNLLLQQILRSDTIEIEDEPSVSSLKVTEIILNFFEKITSKFQDKFKDQIFNEVKDKLIYRMKTITDTEVKEFDIEVPKNLFKKLENITVDINNDSLRRKADKEREIAELELFLKYLDSTRLEKKLKGLQEIKRYITRIEVSITRDSWADEKELRYFDHRSFINWILDNGVLSLIYKKYQHVELIKRSLDIQKFIVQNSETLPDKLLTILWDSCQNSHGEVLTAVYENILDLAPDLDVQGAFSLYSMFDSVSLENYTEEFVDLICQYTAKCLKHVVESSSSGVIRIKKEFESYKNNLFGIQKMFEIAMDESPIDAEISRRVLAHLLNLVNEYFIIGVYSLQSKKCFQNIKEQTSVYQSLAFLNENFSHLLSLPALKDLCLKLFSKKFTGDDNVIISLISFYEIYWKNVRERVKLAKATNKIEIDETIWMQEVFVGKFSHELNVTQILNSLKNFIAHPFPTSPLNSKQFKRLWTLFVVKQNFEFETKLFLELISQTYEVQGKGWIPLFEVENLKEIYNEIICQENYFSPNKFSIEKFKCLRFFFLFVNYKESNLVSEANEDDMFKEENANQILILDTNLLGLDALWEYFVTCNDENIVNELKKFLVHIHTKFGPTRKGEEESLYENTLNQVMKSIEGLIKKQDLPAIERYILFLESFLETIDRKVSTEAFEPYSNGVMDGFSGGLLKVNVNYYPYEDMKQMEFHVRDKLGYIKEKIAKHFDIDINDFDLIIDKEVIINEKLEDQLKDFLNLTNIEMLKRNEDSEFSSSNHRLIKHKDYLDIFFTLFSTFEPERLRKIWNFFQKLPLQPEIKNLILNYKDYSKILEGSQELENSNISKVYYLTSVIRELTLIDPYYWKMKIVDLKTVKSEWAANFVAGKGVESIIQIILNTDLRKINNFLFLKTILQLYQTLNFFFTSYEEMKRFWIDDFFVKTLDTLLYSAKYVASEISAENPQKEILKDFASLSLLIKNLLQNMLKYNLNFCKTFLLYPNLKNLYTEIFINLCNEGQINDFQGHFAQFMNVLFDALQNFPEKQLSTKLFKILFENIAFAALESPKPTIFILRYLAEFLRKYDLQKQFSCSIDISTFITEIVQYIKSYQTSQSHLNESKIEACFVFLKRYLENNPDRLEQYGQTQGLISEILSQGLFKPPSHDNIEKPKYQTPNLIKRAFENLTLLANNEKNFKTIIKFLLSIHENGNWRSYKYSSWNLSTKVKKRVTPYSGLKNLGCTCYMNSTLQQLFMISSFSKTLFQLEDPDFNKEDVKDNILFQLKRLFYGMTHVEKEFFSPKKFCLAFKDIEGNPTNPREQKDAFEFLCLLLDRLEEKVKKTKHENFIKDCFGGSFSNELICKDCTHYYDREEAFLGVNLIIKNTKNIQESLENFVEGQTLVGDNAYECEECKMKVKAVKRVSFKTLPNYLIFVLNRFEYNFDLNIREKLNDYYEFSQELDLEPFTQQAIKNAEKASGLENKQMSEHSKSKGFKQKLMYDLKGTVIHVGSAESGHYYSIIKDSKHNGEGEPKWLEFNDQHVTEFDIKNLSQAAFGDKFNSRNAQSAYILVYEKRSFAESNESVKKKVKLSKDISGLRNGRMELEEINLVDRLKTTEKKSIEEFQKEISQKNLKLFYVEKLLSDDYSQFLWNLIKNTEEIIGKSIDDKLFTHLFQFIWTVYVTIILRAPENTLQSRIFEWIYTKIDKSDKICAYILENFSNREFFTEMLLQCPKEEPKKFVTSIIQRAFRMIYMRDNVDQIFFPTSRTDPPISPAANFLCSMINLLPKTKYYLRSLNSFFGLLRSLMSINLDIIKLLVSKRLIGRLAYYFFCTKEDARFQEFAIPLEYNEVETKLHYGPEITDDPNQNREDDFDVPELVNLNKYFSVLMELLSHSQITDRESYNNFIFHKSGINYKLSANEVKILDLSLPKIKKMFRYVVRDDKKAQKTVCKIIAFLTFGSGDDSQPIFDFIEEAFKSERASEKKTEESFRLIRIIGKLTDIFQTERNKIMLNHIVSAITKRTSVQFQLNEYGRYLRRLIETNPLFYSILKEDARLMTQTLSSLRAAILDENLDPILSKPANYQIRESMKTNLTKLKDFFSDVKLGMKKGEGTVDSENELDDKPLSKWKKGQNVEYYDSNAKKYIKGTIDNIYENIIKMKIVLADGTSYLKWLDDEDTQTLNLQQDKTAF